MAVVSEVLQVVDREVGPRIETYRWLVETPTVWPAHRHVDHEFLVVLAGAVRVHAGGVLRTGVPGSGVWIPAGTEHAVAAARGARFLVGYLDRGRRAGLPRTLSGLPTGPLVVALAEHLLFPPPDDTARERAEEVLCDQLTGGPAAAPDLPMPRSAVPLRVASALVRAPADARTLEQWSAVAGVSARTLTRRFTDETGLGFEAWRRRCRVVASLSLLAADRPVRAVARRVGYRSEAAFVAAFRRETGSTPGARSAGTERWPAVAG